MPHNKEELTAKDTGVFPQPPSPPLSLITYLKKKTERDKLILWLWAQYFKSVQITPNSYKAVYTGYYTACLPLLLI